MPDQRSLLDQLESLVVLADGHGHYDASDWLKARIKEVVGFTPPPRNGADFRECPECGATWWEGSVLSPEVHNQGCHLAPRFGRSTDG